MPANHPLDIVFCVPGMPYDGKTLQTKSLGGSESAGYYMARALARRGHRVKAFTNTAEHSETDDVMYAPLNSWPGYVRAGQTDVHITQRSPELAAGQVINTKLNVLWCHDLALRRSTGIMRAAKWTVDKVVLLSDFHAKQYKEVIGYDDSELFITRNGFDFAAAPPLKGLNQRDPDLFVYCARPERGLDNIVETVLPQLLKHRPTAKLVVCTYDNNVPHLGPFLAKVNDVIRAKKLPVVYAGALTKNQLYELLSRAAAYLYPTPGAMSPEFREISCIAAIEAQACGLPFIHTGWGALTETAPASPVATVDNMGREAARLVLDFKRWHEVQAAQLAHVKRYDWEAIAGEWEAMFYAEIDKNNDCPYRLARWFYKRQEIEGAMAALAKVEPGTPLAPRAAALAEEIGGKYAFLKSPAAFAAHYTAYGKTTIADLESKREHFTRDYIVGNPEPRFNYAAQVFRDKGAKSVLDYGCGHGWSTLYLAGNLGIRVDGVDVDPGALDWARDLAKDVFENKLDCRFTGGIDPGRGPYDGLVCSEVLEHVLDPVASLQEAEAAVKPGGWVVLTVPFGPWELNGPNWKEGGFRQHIREISQADLYDMLQHKPEFSCSAQQQMVHKDTGEGCGFFLVVYKADHSPIRPRDMARKLRIQRPPQTLSVNLIAHAPADLTLRWALESVQHVADEIIVGNTGGTMTEAGLQACRDYGARVIDAPDPLKDGFSAARNTVLDASIMDFVLWMDTDERLIEPQEIMKFLRTNCMAGYTIKQVHMAADMAINPDTPVRLFRRNSGNRFHGLIHEHPETDFNKGPGMVCVLQGMPMLWHVGYSSANVRAQRFFRNRPLLERDRKENPHRALGIFLDCRDQVLMANEAIARASVGIPPGSPPNIPPEALAYAQRAVDLCREFWAANVALAGVQLDDFYTDAMRILGRGFDATVAVLVSRDGVGDRGPGPNGEHTMRFESKADLEAFLKRAVAAKVDPVTGNYW